MLQIKSTEGWKTVRIESKYRHKYSQNRAECRFRFTANPNSAITFEDFNIISWREVPQIDNDTASKKSTDITPTQIYLSESSIKHRCQLSDGEVHAVFATTVPYHLHNRPDCIDAKQKEIESIKRFGTFKEVSIDTLSQQQRDRIIPCSWVIVLNLVKTQCAILIFTWSNDDL